MAAARLIVDIAGTSLTTSEAGFLCHPAVAGVILFRRNIQDYDQLVRLTGELRTARDSLLICVDQEGGRVQRCVDGFTRLPPMQRFNRLYEQEMEYALVLARDTGWLLAAEIIAAGIDFSFTPVLDMDENYSSIIGDRSFSPQAERVIAIASAFIEGAHEAGMAVTGKHFPGHGAVEADSHLQLPVDSRSLEAIVNSDMRPFSALLQQLEAIMPAHILFPEVDPESPVGFSSTWLQQILRRQLGFEGLIFSDDLSMAGATGAGNMSQRVEKALSAGCDLALVCNDPGAARKAALQVDWACFAEDARPVTGMRAARRWCRESLRAEPRWQHTVRCLGSCV